MKTSRTIPHSLATLKRHAVFLLCFASLHVALWAQFEYTTSTSLTVEPAIASITSPSPIVLTSTTTGVGLAGVTSSFSLAASRSLIDGGFQVTLSGSAGTDYTIEVSTDLVTWTELTNSTSASGSILLVDVEAGQAPMRFYRGSLTASRPQIPKVVWIAPGTFTMGSPANETDRYPNEGPQTQVTISQGFWMGKYEVTQGEYLNVMGSNPSSFKGDAKLPVESVSWVDATNFCAKLTVRERAAGRLGTADLYRLPTEAEWEYAARAGTTTRFSYGEDLGFSKLTDYAWYSANSSDTTHPVGQKLANAWGLYDMYGNVWEWCQDWYGSYPGGSVTDPKGSPSGSGRVDRGGGWKYGGARDCRSARRILYLPDLRDNGFGFRVVLAPGQ